MADGSPSDSDRDDDSPGSWREFERVDEQYREPGDPDPFDIEPDIPEAPDPSTNDVDPELSRRFWALVFVFNAALLVTALGLMISLFEGDPVLGGQLLLAGLAVFGFGYYRYRQTRERLDAQRDDTVADEDGNSDHEETSSVDGNVSSDGTTSEEIPSADETAPDGGAAGGEQNG